VTLSKIIQGFLDDCPIRLAAIRTAVDAKDRATLSREAHDLKAAAGNLSALGLFQIAEILEQLRRSEAAA
jgi:HPt (histidine-containing phosphotransfer) domain-containing protein